MILPICCWWNGGFQSMGAPHHPFGRYLHGHGNPQGTIGTMDYQHPYSPNVVNQRTKWAMFNSYCGRKKSCISDDWSPINHGIKHLSRAAGFRNRPQWQREITTLFSSVDQRTKWAMVNSYLKLPPGLCKPKWGGLKGENNISNWLHDDCMMIAWWLHDDKW